MVYTILITIIIYLLIFGIVGWYKYIKVIHNNNSTDEITQLVNDVKEAEQVFQQLRKRKDN